MFDIKGYYEASDLSEALNLLNTVENPMLIAGGTDVLIKSRERKKNYIDINLIGITRIKELKEIKMLENGDIYIGAANTFTTVENNELVKKYINPLSVAVGTVGGPQVRNTGTIGGNLCNGAISADSATTLLSYNAVLGILSEGGIRELDINKFYIGPGKVDLNKGEILQYILIKKENYENIKGTYIKFAQRNAMDIANLGCSVLLNAENNFVKDIRISFGVAAPTPIRAAFAEEFAIGKELTDENINEIGEKCVLSSKARDSYRASKAYREHLIKELPKRAIAQILNGGQN